MKFVPKNIINPTAKQCNEDKLNFFLHTFIYKLTTTEHQPKFVILEDLTWGIKKPCIIDFKLGYVYANGLSSKRVADISTEKGIRLMGVQVLIFNI